MVRNSNNELTPRIWRWRDVGCAIGLSYLIDIYDRFVFLPYVENVDAFGNNFFGLVDMCFGTPDEHTGTLLRNHSKAGIICVVAPLFTLWCQWVCCIQPP